MSVRRKRARKKKRKPEVDATVNLETRHDCWNPLNLQEPLLFNFRQRVFKNSTFALLKIQM
jgi:hypothetical protein